MAVLLVTYDLQKTSSLIASEQAESASFVR